VNAAAAVIELARVADAPRVAVLSRDLVETGLGWSWRAPRVLRVIRSPDNVVLVARAGARLAGAGIMFYGTDEARLNLLAVARPWQRSGLGTRLVRWLESSALTAGISVVYLEVRAGNAGAQAFYRGLGYCRVQRLPGYYRGHESAVVMARDLWLAPPVGAL
jgi:ribosomal-protein-alanine N-acetyltransferase